jgi:hypothetical protein
LGFFDGLFDTEDKIRPAGADVRPKHVTAVTLHPLSAHVPSPFKQVL